MVMTNQTLNQLEKERKEESECSSFVKWIWNSTYEFSTILVVTTILVVNEVKNEVKFYRNTTATTPSNQEATKAVKT